MNYRHGKTQPRLSRRGGRAAKKKNPTSRGRRGERDERVKNGNCRLAFDAISSVYLPYPVLGLIDFGFRTSWLPGVSRKKPIKCSRRFLHTSNLVFRVVFYFYLFFFFLELYIHWLAYFFFLCMWDRLRWRGPLSTMMNVDWQYLDMCFVFVFWW